MPEAWEHAQMGYDHDSRMSQMGYDRIRNDEKGNQCNFNPP